MNISIDTLIWTNFYRRMPQNITLLSLYIVAFFCLWSLLILTPYLGASNSTFGPIDPTFLGVKKLKALLDQRGISYHGVLERKELADLVLSSGVTTEAMAAYALSVTDDLNASDEEFAGFKFKNGEHFYHKVEKSRDSVWIVQVRSDTSNSGMNHTEWEKFSKTSSRFDIKLGYFDCSIDRRFCELKKWSESQLLLALPFRRLDHAFRRYIMTNSTLTADNAIKWVRNSLAQNVSTVNSLDQLKRQWLHFDERQLNSEYIRVILLSNLNTPPLFFSLLSAKFADRVRFGLIDVRTPDGKAMKEELDCRSDSATYLILTPEISYSYGYQAGEVLSYESMALLIRTLKPELGDILMLFFILLSLVCCLEFVLTRGAVLRRNVYILLTTGMFNLIYGPLMWARLLYVITMLPMPSYLLSSYRRICFTSFAASFRAYVLFFSNLDFLVLTTLVIFVITGNSYDSVHNLDDNIDELNDNIDELDDNIDELDDNIDEFDESIDELDDSIDELDNTIDSSDSSDSSVNSETISDSIRHPVPTAQATTRNQNASQSAATLPTSSIGSIGSRPTDNYYNNNYNYDNNYDYNIIGDAHPIVENYHGVNNVLIGNSVEISFNQYISNLYLNQEWLSWLDQLMMPIPPSRIVRHTNNLHIFSYSGLTGDSDANSDSKLIGGMAADYITHVGAAASANAAGASLNSRPLLTMCQTCFAMQGYEGKSEQEMGEEGFKLESTSITYADGDINSCIHCGDIVYAEIADKGIQTQRSSATSSHSTKAIHFDAELKSTGSEKSVEQSGRTLHRIIVDASCAICLENYEISDALCGLPCLHSFHDVCIKQWLTQYNYKCPLCRCPADEDNLNLHNDLQSSH